VEETKIERKPVMAIFDGNHLAARCFFALRLNDSKGRNVSAIYGCLESLTDFVREWLPDGVIVCWDEGKSGHRTKVLPSYKHRRKPATEEEVKSIQDRINQMKVVKEMFSYLGIPQVGIPGCEGDDLCLVLSTIASKADYQSLIISSDKDLLQLVNKDVSWYDPVKKLVVKQDNFREVTGLDIKDFVLYKALMGDAGDDVPGIKGIGPGRALKLINKYKTVDELVNNTDEKEGKYVRGKREELERNLELVDISRAITLDIYQEVVAKLKQSRMVVMQEVIEMLQEYEFKSFLNEIKELTETYANLFTDNERFGRSI